MKNYYHPTPKKWRQIGDAIMLGCTTLSVFIPTSPLGDHGKMWAMFMLNIVGVVGKVFTNFFKEEDVDPQPKQ